MKKTMILLLALAMNCSAVWAETIGVVTGNMLKIRKKPSSKSLSLEAYPAGEKVNILGISQNGKWLKVRVISDGMEGYAYSKYIEPEKSRAPEDATQKLAVVASTEATAPKVVAPVVVSTHVVSPASADPAQSHDPARPQPEAKVVSLVKADVSTDSLRQEIEKLRVQSSLRAGQIIALQKQVTLMNQIPDFRLIAAVEIGGENVHFEGLGAVRMVERGGRVVFRVPAALSKQAKSIFGQSNGNILESPQATYITIDKSRLNLDGGRG